MKKIQKSNIKLPIALFMGALLSLNFYSAWAQKGMTMPTMFQSASADADTNTDSMDFSGMTIDDSEKSMARGQSMGSAMQGGSAPADARDPHAYSGGYNIEDFAEIPRPVLADELNFSALLVDRLEVVRSADISAVVYDSQAWFGRDYNRLVLKAEGEIDSGNIQESSTDLLWSHAIATFWDMQLGARYDSGSGPGKGWLAFGVQGLAPYWFDVDATLYASNKGQTALSLQAEYELLLTQKLIFQPRIETNLYGKSDVKRGQGAGLSDLAVGLRLRYEIRREFAPYIGIKWAGTFGGTANDARVKGDSKNDTLLVAGFRFWF